MDFVIVQGDLCLLMCVDRMMAFEWLPKSGTDIFRRVSREFIR